MKIILQHGAQSVEFEVTGKRGAPLTDDQALAVINYAYIHWRRALPDAPENPNLGQRVAWLLRVMAHRLVDAAWDQRRERRTQEFEDSLAAELG